MLSYLTDRRHKPEEEQLRNLVKPRFTDAELEEIEQEAAMHFGGKLAPAVREYALLGMAERSLTDTSIDKRDTA